MKKIGLLALFLLISNYIFASPEKPLYVIIKNSDICVYTNDKATKFYNHQVYLYMGDIIEGKKFKSTYSKLYKNIKVPVNKNECISISISNFKNSIPYDIVLDMDSTYSTRICVEHNSGKTSLSNVVDGYRCLKISKPLEKEKNVFRQFIDWLSGFLS